MSICDLCPRHCKVNRDKQYGFCGTSEKIKLAKADLFLWEEPVISGTQGSGAVFFCGCNLKCCFCQNYQISSEKQGKEISVQRLAQIFAELEQKGAHNINLVSGSHYAKQIIEALNIYKPQIPVVYNSNGYESLETLESLKNYVDIYLVDLKFASSDLSQKYCKAKDYFSVATSAIKKMLEYQPCVELKSNVMQKGVIIRHMVMPNCVNDSKVVLDWIATNAKTNSLVSLMCQYTPYFMASKHPEINRTITPLEYKIVLNYANKLGIENGFSQDMQSASKSYIPVWDKSGV